MLYAQAAQLDGAGYRNILVQAKEAFFSKIELKFKRLVKYGETQLFFADILPQLAALGFGSKTPFSVLAVELLPQDGFCVEPLAADLGNQRILRTSALIPVAQMC
jgi:hypothetical protein